MQLSNYWGSLYGKKQHVLCDPHNYFPFLSVLKLLFPFPVGLRSRSPWTQEYCGLNVLCPLECHILKPKPQDTKMEGCSLQEGALINGMTAPSRGPREHTWAYLQLGYTYKSPIKEQSHQTVGRPWSWTFSKFPLYISHPVYGTLTAAGKESDRTLGQRVQQHCNQFPGGDRRQELEGCQEVVMAFSLSNRRPQGGSQIHYGAKFGCPGYH